MTVLTIAPKVQVITVLPQKAITEEVVIAPPEEAASIAPAPQKAAQEAVQIAARVAGQTIVHEAVAVEINNLLKSLL